MFSTGKLGGLLDRAVLPPAGRSLPAKEMVPLELERYSCRYARRGNCVIINNHHFNRVLTGQADRDGTEVDAAAVESLFVSLGFEVTRYNDLSINDMSINLRKGTPKVMWQYLGALIEWTHENEMVINSGKAIRNDPGSY